VYDSSPDLDVPINLYRDVLRLRPHGHPDHPFTLLSLGIAVEARFQRQHDEADGIEGKSLLSQVLDVAPADSYAYHAAVLALGSSAKPEQIRPTDIISQTIVNDLDESGVVQRLDAALQWIFHPDSCKHVFLDHLGILFCIRSSRLGDLGDPEKAISTLEAIVQFTSDEHPNKLSWLDVLGVSLWTRYERLGERVDLEKSISMFEDAVRLTPDGHSDEPPRLTSLVTSLSTRYERFGEILDLDRLISLREDALQFTPDGHPDKPSRLSSLGKLLSTRYERLGHAVDLQRSISLREAALQFTPDGHPHKPSRLGKLGKLGNLFLTRYKRLGDVVDLERLISLREAALQLTPDGHPHKTTAIHTAARQPWPLVVDSLCNASETAPLDLERSISLREDALQFTPDEHPDKPLCAKQPWMTRW
jgi:tetratricopeptide (TPR) repeat protein